MSALLIVLVLDMHIKRFDIFWFRVAAMFIESEVIVGQVSLKLAYVFNQGFVLALESEICRVILVDVVNFLFHFGDLRRNVIVLVPQ